MNHAQCDRPAYDAMHSLPLLCSSVLVAAFLAGQPPVRDDADGLIYGAAFDGIIAPLGKRGALPQVVYERTIALCPDAPLSPPSTDCVGSSVNAFEGRYSRSTPLPFADLIRASTRSNLAAAFRERNRQSEPFPRNALPAARAVAEEYVAAAERSGQRVGITRFSRPARSVDGFALVFASYTCGSGCGQGWLILLIEANGTWRVVGKELAWII